MFTLTLQLFDVTTNYSEKSDVAETRQEKTERDKAIKCKLCGFGITSESAKIRISELHVHTFENPSGIIYTFGCFHEAPGITTVGTASYEHTWFPGYSWQIIICSNCGEHLGWLFRNSDAFFALIVDKLANYSI